MTDKELILRYVEVDPIHSGPGNVRLKDSGVNVWAIIGNYLANERDAERTAAEYDLPLMEVEAAVAFYRRFKWAIDARLAENEEFDLESALAATA
ncbi:MAG TPA: hypothetical protein VH482_30845 [Thermomicrobiales bacterium]